jgi:SAM-dependent methyltransferase
MTEINAYDEALGSGFYRKPGNLLGKYDNVRRYWEDEELGLYLRPYLEKLLERKKGGLRILDLGCGSGDGYEFLTGIRDSRSPLSAHGAGLIKPEQIALYRGVDVNDGILRQARGIYGSRKNVDFVLSDINDYDPSRDEPYDIYLANYGTLSHNNDEQTVALLSRIAGHARSGAIVVTDWLGRFAYEWQSLWTRDYQHNQWIDYAISYFRTDGREEAPDPTSFKLRLMSRQEASQIYRQARRRAGGSLALRRLADRSSLVGRHTDTARYNRHCQPWRRRINELFEPNVTTDLKGLIIDYVPREGFDEVNDYYQRLAEWWNHLIAFTEALLEKCPPPAAKAGVPAPVRRAMSTMKKVVRLAAGMRTGSPRASLVEPQLGYCLREIEAGLQRGLGCGHGLVGIFETLGRPQ